MNDQLSDRAKTATPGMAPPAPARRGTTQVRPVSVAPELFRVYETPHREGYPAEWDRLPDETFGLKHVVRDQAGNRCQRCGHPYDSGEGQWSRCDEHCRHLGPIRLREIYRPVQLDWAEHDLDERGQFAGELIHDYGPDHRRMERYEVEALWRILTVHHLNGIKLDCRWWNLAALCQRCHLSVQRRVVMERVYPFEHHEWFKVHAAGWYAVAYLGEDLTRGETVERLEELLALERMA